MLFNDEYKTLLDWEKPYMYGAGWDARHEELTCQGNTPTLCMMLASPVPGTDFSPFTVNEYFYMSQIAVKGQMTEFMPMEEYLEGGAENVKTVPLEDIGVPLYFYVGADD